MKKICVVTTTRADFGLYYWTLKAIAAHPNLQLQLVASGMHLSPEFGYTLTEVEQEFQVDKKVEMVVSSDSTVGTAKGMGLAMIGFADAFADLQPDVLVVLGDRFEMFAAASTATAMNIPIAHLHGGELTLGAIDDALRHSMTKMARWHFVATPKAMQRVIQMGEQPDNVWQVGGLGVETIRRLALLSKSEVCQQLQLDSQRPIGLVTYHPETLKTDLSDNDFYTELRTLLQSLQSFPEVQWVFTKANMDAGGRAINQFLEDHVAGIENFSLFESLGQLRYLSLMQASNVVLGNSSSGIIEAPVFKVPTINIGNRQAGREQANTVLQTPLQSQDLRGNIQKALSSEFLSSIKDVQHPYIMQEFSSEIIVKTLNQQLLTSGAKPFFERSVASLSLPNVPKAKQKHLVVAVHPDDETLGCGATLLKRKAQGAEIYWLIVTSVGEASSLSASNYRHRHQEIQKVAQMYGFNGVYELEFPTTLLDRLAVSELVAKLSQVMTEVQPSHVYLPYYQDVHSDHRMVFDAMMACTKKFRYPFIEQVMMMEVLSETDFAPNIDSGFVPNVFVEVEQTLQKKLEILQIYASELAEFPFPRSLEAVEAQAKVRGVAAGCKAAEAFMLIRAFD